MFKKYRVLDLSESLPGPFCSAILSDIGFEVIKLERPGNGDFMRGYDPRAFETLNRGKKSIVLNLKDNEENGIFRRLVQESDIMIEGFRPGIAAKLGIDYEALKLINPGLIYCSISGYGQTGPYRNLSGHDINYISVGGILGISGLGEVPSWDTGLAAGDIASGMAAVIGILVSLFKRMTTGQGNYLDIGMSDIATFSNIQFLRHFTGGSVESRRDLLDRPGYGVFETRDGTSVSVAILEDHFWNNFWRATESQPEELINYSKLPERQKNKQEVNQLVSAEIRKKTRVEWIDLAVQYDIPIAPVNDIADLQKDPHIKTRGFLLGTNEEIQMLFPVANILENQSYYSGEIPKAPHLGQHTKEILETVCHVAALKG